MPASGEPGGLLVVGGSPGVGDDQAGEPFSAATGRSLRRAIEQYWSGPVRYAYGVSCRGGARIPETSFEACAPFLAGEIDAGSYQRLLVVGTDAARAVFGARLSPSFVVRRAWAYVRGVPAFLIHTPLEAQRNRFVRNWLTEDLRWALVGPIPAKPSGSVRVLWEPAEAVAYLTQLQPHIPVSIDIENVGDAFKKRWEILCIGMSTAADAANVLPGEVLKHPAVRRAFADFLASPAILKGGQFIKYDINGLHREFGVELRGLAWDSGIQRKLIESDNPAKLGVLAWLVGYGGYKQLTEAQMGDGDDQDKSEAYAKLDPDQLHAYNGRDAVVAWLINQHNMRGKRFEPYQKVWARLVKPAIMALAQVERWGARLDEARVRDYDAWLAKREEELLARLTAHKEVPPNFNPGSHPQKAALLFGTLGLKSTLKTKGGKSGVQKDSTSKKALMAIQHKHPIVPLLIELETVRKQRSTYGLSMLEHVGIDGRVHTTYGIVRSGRLSSREPNLQNLTGKGEEGKRTRGCWVAPPGHKLVSMDFGQIELRMLADQSGDEAMLEAFNLGRDLHTETTIILARMQRGMSREEFLAAYGNGTDGEKWAIDLRKAAKIVNFSLVFGKGDKGLAEDLAKELKRVISPTEAREIRAAVLDAFPAIAKHQARQIAEAAVSGSAWTDWDGCRRRRNVWLIGEAADSEFAPERDPRNVVKNHPVQGTASEYTLASLIEIVQRQQDGDLPGRLIMTIHDELVSEVREQDVLTYAREAKKIMTSWPTKRVKLAVDCEVGDDLGHMTKLVLE